MPTRTDGRTDVYRVQQQQLQQQQQLLLLLLQQLAHFVPLLTNEGPDHATNSYVAS